MRFKKIYIEITNTCNLSCSFCVQNQRKPQRMTIAQFREVIRQIRPFTKYVYLHVLGEPLSHPDLGACLNICKEADLQVNITTNGTLLKEKQEILMTNTIRQLNISLHSFPQHKQVQYVEEAIEIGKALAQKKTFVSYRLWCLRHQQLEQGVEDIVKALMQAYQTSIADISAGTYRLADYTFLHFEEIFTWPTLANPFVGETGTCLGMKQMCGILSDGTLVPCCLDAKKEASLGNIFETQFAELIATDHVKHMVEGFQNQKVVEPLCQHCSYRLRFTRR